MPLIIGAKSATASGVTIANSCRFEIADSTDLTKTSGTATDVDICTVSAWVKRGSLSAGDEVIMGEYTDASNRGKVLFHSSDRLVYFQKTGGSTTIYVAPTRLFRDVGAWYHIVVAFDTTQVTDTDKIKFYVNGVQETDFTETTYGSTDQNVRINESSAPQFIGQAGGSASYFSGYLAEVCFIDGQQLTPSSFGEYDEDSPTIWKPKSAADVSGLTFGNNGFYFNFEDSADLGADVSGNSNDFTATNLDATDQATDTPTNNFATMNPLSKYEMTFSEGNCKVVTASDPRTDDNARGTMGVSSGKWYWEVKGSGGTNPVVAGICFDKLKMGSDLSGLTGVYAIQNAGATYAYKRENGTTAETTGFPNPVNDNIINVAFDADNAKLYIGINGTYYNQAGSTGDPAAGSNETFSSIDTSYFWLPFIESRGASQLAEMNFGGCPAFTVSSGNADGNGYGNFEYAVPSGYYALCTKNLAEYG
jgi:hypothetical protein